MRRAFHSGARLSAARREPLHGRGGPYILSQKVFQSSIVEHRIRQKPRFPLTTDVLALPEARYQSGARQFAWPFHFGLMAAPGSPMTETHSKARQQTARRGCRTSPSLGQASRGGTSARSSRMCSSGVAPADVGIYQDTWDKSNFPELAGCRPGLRT